MVNEEDHLRLACMDTGLCLQEVYAAADDLDNQLEDRLRYAASIEWGYLASRLENAGTGLRASVMLHMSALAADGTIGWILKRINQMGLQIKGYWGDGDDSLGDMYQISNPVSIGVRETEILASVEEAAREMVDYERKAREETLSSRRIELEDRVHRAFGLLSSCRLISSKEAISLLSTIRMGISLGIIDEPQNDVVTTLMIRAQRAHVQKSLDQTDDDADNKLVDYTRAQKIRQALRGHVREDNDV
jgi:protein arginine kinase